MKKILIGVMLMVLAGVAVAADRATKKQEKNGASQNALRSYAQMVSSGEIRIAVAEDASLYFLREGKEQGFAPEIAHAFEIWINQKFVQRKKQRVIHVVLVKSSRDDLFNKVKKGEADLAFADLGEMASDKNKARGLSLQHSRKPAEEVLVSGRSVLNFSRIDDLSGQTVLSARQTNLEKSLSATNMKLIADGKPPIELVKLAATERAQEEKVLERLDAGTASFVIVSEWKANLWQSVFRNIQIHQDISAQDPNWLGWAARRDCTDLLKDVAAFEASGYDALAKQRFRLAYLKLVDRK
ncbi:extracellular solute-binding protein (family 3) [Jezberella montanilacus]|jgi:membrane-bound lytic murein transglycosylase MltF|uniref:Extracellular solute-binding protein (Family 3) n=1 Tax=Jezberella montanilacus TaxID=323426 RepID=A0A2T0XQ95_9BURK|nr:transporter substrate-binding domain-containing protein [Jezberella montanilacus]PRZ01125.1 extracellular solute-binding protein (family 3) [Jezberella montanilacus]